MASNRTFLLWLLVPWALAAAARGQVSGPGILWQTSHPDVDYYAAAISIAAAKVVAGTSHGTPSRVELYELEGPNVPLWTFPLPASDDEVVVDAARNADVFAAASVDFNAPSVTVRGWTSASATPAWTVPISSVTLGAIAPDHLVVSHDGSTVAVLTNDGVDDQLRFFDAATGGLIGAPTTLGFGRRLDLTADGRYAALIDGATALVIDRDTGGVRGSVATGASTDSVSISEDAGRLAFGFLGFSVHEWDGSEYALLWSEPFNGTDFTFRTELSADGETLFVTLYEPAALGRVEAWDVGTASRLWFYDYAGTVSSIPAHTAVSSQGGYLAVGLGFLGADASDDPEVAVFSRTGGGPLSSYEVPTGLSGTPVDVVQGPSGPRVVGAAIAAEGVEAHLFCAAVVGIFADGFESGDVSAWTLTVP